MFPQFVVFTLTAYDCDVSKIIKRLKNFASSSGYNVTYERFDSDTSVVSLFDNFETFVIDIELTKKGKFSIGVLVRCFSCPLNLVEKIKALIQTYAKAI